MLAEVLIALLLEIIMQQCPNCWEPMSLTANRCPHCGQREAPAAPASRPGYPIWLVFFLMLVFAVLFVRYLGIL